MAVGVRALLGCATIGLCLTFAAISARAEVDERYNNPAAAEPVDEAQAAPEPAAKPKAESSRQKRRAKSEARRKSRAARARAGAAPAEAAAAAPAVAEEAAPSDGATPLTVRTYGAGGENLAAALTLRDLARKERRMKPVMAAPASLTDRPAPTLPGDKAKVEEEVGEETEVVSPRAPRHRDAPTSREEAEFLIKQTPRVVTACFPASLRLVLGRMSKHFGSPVIVTSGFRAYGRRHSQHRYCKAADIQIAGVRPSQIVGYAQLQDEVGGIGTYSHTRSVHVDVRDQKISWYGNRGRGHFRLAKDQFGVN